MELAWSGLALLSVFELSLALKSFWLMLFLLLLLLALLTSMSMMLKTERRRAMMLKVLMLLLAVRKVFRYGKSEVKLNVLITSDYQLWSQTSLSNPTFSVAPWKPQDRIRRWSRNF